MDIYKLLICNGAHLGDVILTTSLLPAIREAYPTIQIGMLVGSWSLPVIQDHPLIDKIHIVNHWKLDRAKSWSYLKTRSQALKEIKEYDTAIDCCFHFPNCAPLLWQAKIPVRIGFQTAGFSLFLTHALPWDPSENRSAVHAYFSLLHYFPKIKSTSLCPNLPLSPRKESDPYIVIHMGSGHPMKEWPLANWIELTKRLQGHRLIFTGRGEKENRQIEAIRKHVPIENYCDALNWPEFVSMIQNASLLIGVDTSAGHIASATETPAVLIFTSVHPPDLWRPFHPSIQTVRKKMACSPCFTGCRTMNCIKEISVEEVLEKCELFFKQQVVARYAHYRRNSMHYPPKCGTLQV